MISTKLMWIVNVTDTCVYEITNKRRVSEIYLSVLFLCKHSYVDVRYKMRLIKFSSEIMSTVYILCVLLRWFAGGRGSRRKLKY